MVGNDEAKPLGMDAKQRGAEKQKTSRSFGSYLYGCYMQYLLKLNQLSCPNHINIPILLDSHVKNFPHQMRQILSNTPFPLISFTVEISNIIIPPFNQTKKISPQYSYLMRKVGLE